MYLSFAERTDAGFRPSAATTVQSLQLGGVGISHVKARTAQDDPTRGYRDPGDDLVWAFVLGGVVSVRHLRSEFETAMGATSMSQVSRLEAFRYTPDFSAVSVRLDLDTVGLTPGALEAMTRIAFPLGQGVPLVISSMARQALRQADALGEASRAALATAVIDLTSAFVDDFLGRRTAPEVTRRTLVGEALRHVELYGSDPSLDPARVADGIGVSLRVLQKAFQAEGRSIAASITESRLLRAAALLDRSNGHVSIEHVGERCGFASASAFGRAFRRRWGASPRDWRRERMEARAADA